MRKNAGIKSKKEAAQRLIDGEVFYWDGAQLSFRDNDHEQPFGTIMISRSSNLDMNVSWGSFDEWEVDVDWRENIGKGVWCWVWDSDESDRSAFIVKNYNMKDKMPYITDFGGWMNAEPMTEAEVMEYVLK